VTKNGHEVELKDLSPPEKDQVISMLLERLAADMECETVAEKAIVGEDLV